MRRREFIAGLGCAAALPTVTLAQQPKKPVIGYISSSNRSPPDAFLQGLSEVGYNEGRNVAIDFRWSDDQGTWAKFVAEFVRRPVSVIVSVGAAATAQAIKASMGEVPLVFLIGPDPVKLGFVASLGRPGRNVTGVANMNTEIVPKRLELLRQILPSAKNFALLDNPSNPGTTTQATEVPAAAQRLGIELRLLHASTDSELSAAFGALQDVDGLVIGADEFFNSRMEELAELALRFRIPTVFQFREFVAAGGLMSYGPRTSNLELWRQAGLYTGRILNGERAANLPVVQPTKFEFVINLKTAKALGLSVPQSLLVAADQVIE
jgi:putative tryptophan/tyrosine transport system substrate-binding protein